MIAPTFVSKLQLAQIVKPVFIDVRLHDYVMKAKKYDLVPNSIHSKFDVDTSEFTDGNIEQQLPSDKNAAIA